MTDKDLLQKAAKAVGFEFNREFFDPDVGLLVWEPPTSYESRDWNPLTDDGDALRLAVRLDMCFGIAPHAVALDKTSLALAPGGVEVSIKHNDDPYAATRRAIVRAAAELGKEK